MIKKLNVIGIILATIFFLSGFANALDMRPRVISSGKLVRDTSPQLGGNLDVNGYNIVMTDDEYIGLGAAAGRIVFDDQATDTITFSNADVKIGARITFGGGTNADGITFGSLGTATKGIDLSGSGLTGSGDYLIYFGANDYWSASGYLKTTSTINSGSFIYSASGFRSTTDTETIEFSANNLVLSAGKNIIGSLVSTTGAFFLGNKTAIGTWSGDGVSSAGTANITDVGGAAHGLSLAVGDLVHISNCTTASHKGFYRIVTAGATTLVLDRVLAATNTDLTVTFYKDVIGFFATDGTNGQRITGYSHQDKPLQIGGDVLAATGYSLGGEDVLIGGKLEVNGAVYLDDILTTLPDAVSGVSVGVAASVATVVSEITTDGDSGLDNVTLAAGVDGQIKIFSVVAVGNAADSVKITPASMIGGTQITFAANPLGLGCIMVYDTGVGGWVVVSNNGGTIT